MGDGAAHDCARLTAVLEPELSGWKTSQGVICRHLGLIVIMLWFNKAIEIGSKKKKENTHVGVIDDTMSSR